MRKKNHPVRNFFIFMIICGLVYTGYYIFEKTDFFIISKIHVIGNYKATDQEILESLGDQAHLIKTSQDQLEKNISSHPWIKSTSVKKVFPNRLELVVIERTPVIAVEYSDHYLLIDDDFVVLESTKTPKDYDVVFGLDIDYFNVGVAISYKNQYILRNTIDLVYFLSFYDLTDETEIIIEDEDIILRFNDQLIADFGDGQNMEARFFKMLDVYKTIQADGNAVGTIIVNHDGEPTLNPFDY